MARVETNGESYQPPAIDFDDYEGSLAHKTTGELRASRFVLRTIKSPLLMRTGRFLATAGLKLRVPGTVRAIERTVFRQFCGGTDLAEACERAERLYERGVGSILDYAVEAEDEESELDRVTEEILRVVETTIDRPEIPFAAIKLTGVARFELLERIDAGESLSEVEQEELARAEARLTRMADAAAAGGTAIFVDAEHSWVQDAIDTTVERFMAKYNHERAVIHTTVQLYLADRLDYLRRALDDARTRGYVLGVKLVRGAYMELENERAAELGYDSPIQPSKAATDAAYDQAITLCLENIDVCTMCAATHNITSTRHVIEEMARLGIAKNDPRVTLSQLLGMFDRVTFPLADAGYNALKYLPYGGVRDAFPYLLRRADENKSVADQLGAELEAVQAELARRAS